ncbi:MAG TPA: PIG-L family deacetylase [Pyrinomonadaceae bacterium]|nr:PIG-L family deacetylase [Pyrinomonadaceae bacterium]
MTAITTRQSASLNKLSLDPVATTTPRALRTWGPRSAPGSDTSADRIALYQALLDLRNPWTVMCVAAHPDDEDGTSLIVMRHKFGAHTVSLFSTYGEGGQNAIGPELYEEMGAIRAHETMAAAEIQGSEPHFLGLKDFGFSKTREEAFRFWGHEEALRRMVLEIRKLRPDVIITNHSTTSNDHGQHQATATMVVEAFDAAADPNKFSEQLKDGVTTWQVQRLFVRQRGNQAANNTPSIVTIDPNEQDPVRGVVFAEESLRALQQHATQGPWPKSFAEYANRFRAFSGQNAPTGQLPSIRYVLVKSATGADPMPAQESHNFLDGLRLSPAVAQELQLPDFGPTSELLTNMEHTREALIETYREARWDTPGKADPPRHELMRGKMERAAALALGLKLNTDLPAKTVVANSTINVPIKISNGGPEPITVLDCGARPVVSANQKSVDVKINHAAGRALSPGAAITLSEQIQIPTTAKINVPLAEHLYEPMALGLNEDIRCTYEIDKTKIGIDLPLRLDVAPPLEIANITPKPLVLMTTPDAKASNNAASPPGRRVSLEIKLVNHQTSAFQGVLGTQRETNGHPISKGETMPIALAPNETKIVKASVTPFGDSLQLSLWNEKVSAPSKQIPISWTNVAVPGNLRVGYVRGFDFSLPNALNALGVESKELNVDEVKTADLSKFTSVIVDNRVYESKPELIAVNQKLLDYAQAGGTLIVFYHKSDEWNPDERRKRPQLAPYKLLLGGERVTDENAPITFIEPDHPLLNTPNKMGQDDFKDWIQERGLYYPREWDPQFHALLQSNDPGENPLKGGLLVADYGKGHYIYTSMVWYRELRGGIPGAYKMLANMISYGRN